MVLQHSVQHIKFLVFSRTSPLSWESKALSIEVKLTPSSSITCTEFSSINLKVLEHILVKNLSLRSHLNVRSANRKLQWTFTDISLCQSSESYYIHAPVVERKTAYLRPIKVSDS